MPCPNWTAAHAELGFMRSPRKNRHQLMPFLLQVQWFLLITVCHFVVSLGLIFWGLKWLFLTVVLSFMVFWGMGRDLLPSCHAGVNLHLCLSMWCCLFSKLKWFKYDRSSVIHVFMVIFSPCLKFCIWGGKNPTVEENDSLNSYFKTLFEVRTAGD